MSRIVLKRGNDQSVRMTGLHKVGTSPKQYLNAATVKASLFDSKGLAVPSYQNVTMAYVPDSNGTYEWVIEGSLMSLAKGQEYSLVFTAEETGMNYRTVHQVTVAD
jgi:hypothetical protein